MPEKGASRVALVLVASGLGLALGLAAFFVYGRLRGPTAADLPTRQTPEVHILDPGDGSQLPLGSPIPIDVQATAGLPIQGLELWIDGQLLGLQEHPGEGSDSFQATFVWMPSHPGVHGIGARALGAQGPLAFSDVIHVQIFEAEYATDRPDVLDFDVPVVLPQAEGGAPVSGPPAGEPVAEAEPSSAPREYPPDPGMGPAAPQLAVEADGCLVALKIHDLSQDEESFSVYRQPVSAMGWSQVAQFEPHEGTGWMEASLPALPGGSTYYAASFHEGGESPGNMALVNVDPADCAPLSTERSVFDLNLGMLLSDSEADRAYCYRSFNGAGWERIPKTGFFPLGSPESARQPSMQINLTELGQGTDGGELRLLFDCWGWRGGELGHLGQFEHSFDLTNLGALPDEVPGSAFDGALQLRPESEATTFFPLGGDFADFDWSGAIGKFELLQDDPSMPYFHPMVTKDPDICKNHLPADAQNWLGQTLFCSPYPGFTPGLGSENPQPYLVWDPINDCPLGDGSPPCTTYQEWLEKAEQEDGDLRFAVRDSSSAGTFSWSIGAGDLRSWVIKPLDCAGKRNFQVHMYYVDEDEFKRGPESIMVSTDCPHPVPWEIPLDVTFESIRFYNLDDGESDIPQDVEVYGFMLTQSAQESRYLNLAEWGEQGDDCPDETIGWFGSLDTGGGLTITCPKIFHDAFAWDLSDVALCQGTSRYNCSVLGWDFNHNTVRVHVNDGEGLGFQVLVVDWDDASANDLQCLGAATVPARDRFAWAQVQDEPFVLESIDWGSGSCRIEGSITAVLP